MSNHYVLKIQYTNKPAETRNIEAPVTVIGREAGDIVLGDAQASGRHAELHFQGGQVTVKDLGSTNGTFFNGQRSQSFGLGPGQSFTIGQSVLTLMAVHGAGAGAGAAGRGPAKTMIAMGGVPPRPPGPAPGGAPGGAPAGFGAPPPAAPPPSPSSGGFGAPVGSVGGAAPSSGGKLGGAPPQGFGAPGGAPPSNPPGGAPPQGFGAPGTPGGAPPSQPPSNPPGGASPSGAMGMAMAPAAGGPMPAAAASGGGMPPATQSQPQGAAPAAAAPQSISIPGGALVPKFNGTGGEIFGQLFVGGLLTVITAGIYMPWFMVKLINYVMTKTEVSNTGHGTLRGSFTGTGGQLFVHMLVGYLLTIVTLGIYTPWFICRMLRWGAENFTLTADDGTTYKLRFEGTGGALFGKFILGAILCIITLYIYMPWFMVDIRKWLYGHTTIMKNGQEAGKLEFVGTGGSLFGTLIVGAILTVITLYIYFPWFQCKLNKYWAENTRIKLHDRTITPDFVGTGGELFVIGLVGFLLLPITLYIYSFWLMAKLLRFNIENHHFHVQQGGDGGQQALAQA